MKKIIPNSEWLTQLSQKQAAQIENNTKFLNKHDIPKIVVYERIEAPTEFIRIQYCRFLVDKTGGEISKISARHVNTEDKDLTNICIIIETNTDKKQTTLRLYKGDAELLSPQAKFVVEKSLENHNKELARRAEEQAKREPSAFIKHLQKSR